MAIYHVYYNLKQLSPFMVINSVVIVYITIISLEIIQILFSRTMVSSVVRLLSYDLANPLSGRLLILCTYLRMCSTLGLKERVVELSHMSGRQQHITQNSIQEFLFLPCIVYLYRFDFIMK